MFHSDIIICGYIVDWAYQSSILLPFLFPGFHPPSQTFIDFFFYQMVSLMPCSHSHFCCVSCSWFCNQRKLATFISYLHVSDLLHWTWCSPVPSIFLQMTGFHSSAWLNSICCVYMHLFFIHSSVDRHLGWFHSLVTVVCAVNHHGYVCRFISCVLTLFSFFIYTSDSIGGSYSWPIFSFFWVH